MVNRKISRRDKHSSNLHTKNRCASTYFSGPAKKLILFVIIFAMFTVIVAVICAVFLNHEARVKSQISALAADYYENYFYESLINSSKSQSDSNINSVMEKYNPAGLSPLTLSDLLTYDNQKNNRYAGFLSEYCDIDNTFIKLYPDPPYERTSYHAEYTYSCNF